MRLPRETVTRMDGQKSKVQRSMRPATRRSVADDRRIHSAHAHRARDRRHDLRVLRESHREEAQPPRRRFGVGQLRHREGDRHCARRLRSAAARRGGREDRLYRRGPGAPGIRSRFCRRAPGGPRTHRTASAPDRFDRARRAGDRAGDGPGAAVHLLAVGVARPGRTRRGPSTAQHGSTSVTEPPPWTR